MGIADSSSKPGAQRSDDTNQRSVRGAPRRLKTAAASLPRCVSRGSSLSVGIGADRHGDGLPVPRTAQPVQRLTSHRECGGAGLKRPASAAVDTDGPWQLFGGAEIEEPGASTSRHIVTHALAHRDTHKGEGGRITADRPGEEESAGNGTGLGGVESRGRPSGCGGKYIENGLSGPGGIPTAGAYPDPIGVSGNETDLRGSSEQAAGVVVAGDESAVGPGTSE